MTERPTAGTFERIVMAAQSEFQRLGLDYDEATAEAVSFAYAATEILADRLREARAARS